MSTWRLLAAALPLLLISGCATTAMETSRHLAAAAAIQALQSDPAGDIRRVPACRSALEIERSSNDGRLSRLSMGDAQLLFAPATGADFPGPVKELASVAILPGAGLPAAAADVKNTLRPSAPMPAPRSALISDRTTVVDVSRVDWSGWRLTLFTQRDGAGATGLLALAARRSALGPGVEHMVWFPQQDSRLNLAALEHLYRHAFGLEATGSFRFVSADSGHAALAVDGAVTSHAAVLRAIAVARQCAAASIEPRHAIDVVPWRAVELSRDGRHALNAKVSAAGIRLMDSDRPLQEAEVTFWRLPHSGCKARTGADGTAACRLEDLMDDGKHPGFESAPIVATYAGQVTPEFVRLPTTHVFRR